MAQLVDKKVKMTLVGKDGNAFSLMGAFSGEARRQGWTQDEIGKVTNQCMQGDYNELIATLMNHIEDDSHEEDEEEDFFDEANNFDELEDY